MEVEHKPRLIRVTGMAVLDGDPTIIGRSFWREDDIEWESFSFATGLDKEPDAIADTGNDLGSDKFGNDVEALWCTVLTNDTFLEAVGTLVNLRDAGAFQSDSPLRLLAECGVRIGTSEFQDSDEDPTLVFTAALINETA